MSYYDIHGKPMDMIEWSKAFGSPTRWRMLDKGEVWQVSTVWVGLDAQLTGPPLIFESMAWREGAEVEQWRYATQEEAIEGHRKLINLVRERDERAFK